MGKTKHSSNSILHGFTADKLAILITDAVVGGGFKTKGEARKRVEDLIKVFIKMGSSGKELNRQITLGLKSERIAAPAPEPGE